MLDEIKKKLFSWIENSIELAVELETELTKRPAISPESGGGGELDKCLFLENWLKAHNVTQIERFDSPDSRAKGGIRPNLTATIPGKNTEERLWILSHIDVVPEGDVKLWDSDPWVVTRKNNGMKTELIGRGTEDNQQGIVSSTLAALSFLAQGIMPERTVKLLFASDEECGSVFGINWLVNEYPNLFKKTDMVLVPDGGDIKGENIEIAEKSILWAKFAATGKQTHGSMPNTGINAFIAGSDLSLQLYNRLSEKFSDIDPIFDPPCSTFQPTKKEANVPNINTIPGEDVFYMDMRILPRFPIKLIIEEIDIIKSEIEKKYGVTINMSAQQMMESKPTSKEAPIVKILSCAAKEIYNVTPKTIGIGGGTMAACLRNMGIDCAVWTKTQETLHKPNEYALVENIICDAKVMALIAMTKC